MDQLKSDSDDLKTSEEQTMRRGRGVYKMDGIYIKHTLNILEEVNEREKLMR